MPITEEILKNYKKDYLIETGTLTGSTVEKARLLGFKKIFSIELSSFFANKCKEKFKKYKNIEILEGDSGKLLKDIIKKIDRESLFWLDAHYSKGNTAGEGLKNPILKELECIGMSNIKTHTILIDDMRIFSGFNCNKVHIGKLENIIQTDDYLKILQKLKKINKEYKVSYIDSKFANNFFKHDILVARI